VKSENKGLLLGLLGVIAFGLTLPFTQAVVPYMDPVFIGLGRAVVAAIISALILLVMRVSRPQGRDWLRLLGVVAGVVIGFPVLSAYAMQTVPASHGGVVLGILPLATAIAATLVSGEQPSKRFWLVSFIGSALVVAYSLYQGAGAFSVGDIALVGAVIAASFGYAIGGTLSRRLGGWQVICWALVISLPIISYPAWRMMPDDFSAIPTETWLAFAYLALVSQLLGFFFWNQGLAIGGIAKVSQCQLLQPFVTLIGSAIIVGEVLDSITIGCAILVVGVVAIGKRMPVTQKGA